MTDEQLREVMRRAWSDACTESAAARPSMVIGGGEFALTVTRRDAWSRMAHAAGVPTWATQTTDNDTLTCRWESVGDSIFGAGGLMASQRDGYEVRQSQVQMARVVQRSVEMREHAFIEAATGVGKSFGYLAPLLAMGKRILVSTSNKALQSQLIDKDLPFLQTLYNFTFAVALGKGNYICNAKVEDPRKGGYALEGNALEWYLTQNGVVENAPEDVGQYRAGDDCTGKRCALYYVCHFYRAKRGRDEADVIVTNHALLAQHAKNPAWGILPQTDVIVIDEAHAFPQYARSAMGTHIDMGRIRRVASLAGMVDLTGLEAQLAGLATEQQTPVNGRIETDVIGQLLNLADRLWAEGVEPESSDEAQKENRANRVRRMAAELEQWCTSTVAVRWIERGETGYTMVGQPAEIDSLVACLATIPIIFCSATLAAPDLDTFAGEVGLHGLQAQLGSPFDYRRNAMVYVPTGAVDVAGELAQLVGASGGGAFLLFTTNAQLNGMYALLHPVFARAGLTVFRQGELSRQEIAERFRADGNAVLFATRTFFEGVSIEGAALRLVVLDKLPFEPPTPLSMAQEAKRGFSRVTLAKMLLDLKQASGRLIRTQTDRGVIAILDSRVHTRGYGQAVKRCLPPAPLTTRSETVKQFYAN